MTLAVLNFVHPALLGGAALIGIPILIHLFNKRRFRVVDCRRLQLEDLLILLLRCLVVLLLALLVARMILTGSAGMARAAGARTERVFILDDSPSMGVRQGNRALFTRATAALGDYTRKPARDRAALPQRPGSRRRPRPARGRRPRSPAGQRPAGAF